MPYAQLHYPFENKDKFERNFPADFIAEGLDQVHCVTCVLYMYLLNYLNPVFFARAECCSF